MGEPIVEKSPLDIAGAWNSVGVRQTLHTLWWFVMAALADWHNQEDVLNGI